MDVYARLQELGHALPPLPPAGGIYKPVRQVGNLLFVSGQGPGAGFTGKVGGTRSIEEGREAALRCALHALSVLHGHLGDLNRVAGLIKTQGFVASAAGFNDQPKVIDGASELLRSVWGEDGIGARTAISAFELPGDITVEIEFIFELKA